eukprot:gene8742-8833_t
MVTGPGGGYNGSTLSLVSPAHAKNRFSGLAARRLYGVASSDPNTLILLRHRAVLFGIVGGLCLMGAFKPGYQWLGLLVGAVSTLSFLLLAGVTGGFNAHLQRVVVADGLALVCLVAGAGALSWSGRGGTGCKIEAKAAGCQRVALAVLVVVSTCSLKWSTVGFFAVLAQRYAGR